MKFDPTQPPSEPVLASGIAVHCSHSRLSDVTSLIPNPANPNRHPETQIALLAKIIRAQGWRNPIVVSRRSGFVVSGHGRLAAAGLLQVQTVPVDDQDFATEAEETAHLLADNRLAELAEMDSDALEEALEKLKESGVEIELAGFLEMPDLGDGGKIPEVTEGARIRHCPKCGHEFTD